MSKKAAKREQLLNAGLLLLTRKPPDKISMEDIALQVGVTKPMVYYYFGSKVGFYKELVKHVADSMEEMLTDCLKPGISFRELLKTIIQTRIEQLIDRPEFSNAVRIMVTSKTLGDAESRSKILGVFNKLQPIFDQAVDRGEVRNDTELHLTMALLNSLLDGAVRIHGNKFFNTVSPDGFAEVLIRLVFDGIGTGKRS